RPEYAILVDQRPPFLGPPRDGKRAEPVGGGQHGGGRAADFLMEPADPFRTLRVGPVADLHALASREAPFPQCLPMFGAGSVEPRDGKDMGVSKLLEGHRFHLVY